MLHEGAVLDVHECTQLLLMQPLTELSPNIPIIEGNLASIDLINGFPQVNILRNIYKISYTYMYLPKVELEARGNKVWLSVREVNSVCTTLKKLAKVL